MYMYFLFSGWRYTLNILSNQNHYYILKLNDHTTYLCCIIYNMRRSMACHCSQGNCILKSEFMYMIHCSIMSIATENLFVSNKLESILKVTLCVKQDELGIILELIWLLFSGVCHTKTSDLYSCSKEICVKQANSKNCGPPPGNNFDLEVGHQTEANFTRFVWCVWWLSDCLFQKRRESQHHAPFLEWVPPSTQKFYNNSLSF